MTIIKAIEYFLASLDYAGHSKHTIKAYTQDINQWKETLDKEMLSDLTYEDFEKYLMELHKKNLKTTSLRRKRVVVHRFLKYCYEKKFCCEKYYDYIDQIKLRQQKKPKEVLTSNEIEVLFTYVEEEIKKYKMNVGTSNYYDYMYYTWIRNRLITTILLYTGCRANEVVSIKKDAIDYKKNTLTILAKGNKYNSIPLHEQLQLAFLAYEKDYQLIEDCQLMTEIEKSNYMFPSKIDNQKHLASRTLHDLMKKYSEVLDRHLHAHIFRHTFASYCIASNMDISTISSLISHSNPSITLSIYTHEIEANQKHREMKKLNFNTTEV